MTSCIIKRTTLRNKLWYRYDLVWFYGSLSSTSPDVGSSFQNNHHRWTRCILQLAGDHGGDLAQRGFGGDQIRVVSANVTSKLLDVELFSNAFVIIALYDHKESVFYSELVACSTSAQKKSISDGLIIICCMTDALTFCWIWGFLFILHSSLIKFLKWLRANTFQQHFSIRLH